MYPITCLDQSILQIVNVAGRRGRQKPRRVFLLRAIEDLAVMTSWHPTNLVQASLELKLHEDSYPFSTRPHHFVVLVLVNSRHFQKSDKKRCARVYLIDLGVSNDLQKKLQALSGSLAAHSSRSFDRCLLHWRSPCSALSRFLGRLYLTYSSCTSLVPLSEPVMYLPSAGTGTDRSVL